jgi:hypothetical protein
MHPTEAIHGDMGMLVKGDVVLAISNSGETEELIRLMPTIKRVGAEIIAITGNPASTLARGSDHHLNAAISKEACPLGLAPTVHDRDSRPETRSRWPPRTPRLQGRRLRFPPSRRKARQAFPARARSDAQGRRSSARPRVDDDARRHLRDVEKGLRHRGGRQ